MNSKKLKKTSSEALKVFSMGFVIIWTGSFFGLSDVFMVTFLWLKILLT